jgi:prepilin signal peptidase PulO-like enzyme (type II secretory pathway)
MSLALFFIFFAGACVGSYLNVLIHRLPLGSDTVFTRSHCPQCKDPIKWYHNVPLIGYSILMGKCRNCDVQISIRYPIVELIAGLLAVILMPRQIDAISLYYWFLYFSLACAFIVHFFVDLSHKILPDKVNLYIAVLLLSHGVAFSDWKLSLLGGLFGFAVTYGVTWAFYKYSGKVGLGGGDIKLFGALGFYLGPQGIMMNIFLSCFLGAVITLALIAAKKVSRDQAIAFGPFIILTAIYQIYFPIQYSKLLGYLGLIN